MLERRYRSFKSSKKRTLSVTEYERVETLISIQTSEGNTVADSLRYLTWAGAAPI